jgi:hypothetical protein
MNIHEGYEYNIETYVEEINTSYWTGSKPEEQVSYVYTIFTEHTDYDSDQYYNTEQEAEEAAKSHIDTFFDGPDEPDYDAPTAQEMYERAHEDRQKLRGY